MRVVVRFSFPDPMLARSLSVRLPTYRYRGTDGSQTLRLEGDGFEPSVPLTGYCGVFRERPSDQQNFAPVPAARVLREFVFSQSFCRQGGTKAESSAAGRPNAGPGRGVVGVDPLQFRPVVVFTSFGPIMAGSSASAADKTFGLKLPLGCPGLVNSRHSTGSSEEEYISVSCREGVKRSRICPPTRRRLPISDHHPEPFGATAIGWQ
jgi:hypothetical protein